MLTARKSTIALAVVLMTTVLSAPSFALDVQDPSTAQLNDLQSQVDTTQNVGPDLVAFFYALFSSIL